MFKCFFVISRDGRILSSTNQLITKLLVLDPKVRLSATQVLKHLSEIIDTW